MTIQRLGAGGDGSAETAEGRLFIPFTLPGETAEIERSGNRARVTRLIEASGERVTPPCPHFGACGGCALQHMALPAYLAWKREIVATSLRLHGITADVAPVVSIEPGARRRAVFSAVKTATGVVLGFNRAHAQEIIAIEECPVLDPAIVARLAALRQIAEIAVKPRKRARMTVLAADNGLDIGLVGGGRVEASQLDRLAAFSVDPAIARLSIDGAPIFTNRRPEMAAGGLILLPTPGGFVQAARSAEEAMAAAVIAHVGEASPVADLFAGIGTFTMRLARRAPVTAVDGDAVLIEALNEALGEAARYASGLKPVTTVRRDLFVNPMSPTELDRFGAIVFDPPAAGARAQAERIAQSRVAKVVAVSCNPATLARDGRILLDGGYRLTRVVPIDQFLWSAKIEAVAGFVR